MNYSMWPIVFLVGGAACRTVCYRYTSLAEVSSQKVIAEVSSQKVIASSSFLSGSTQ